MNVHCAVPEQRPVERRRTLAVLLIVLAASLLLLALIFVVPLLTGSPSERFISSDWSGYSVASNLNDPRPQVTSVSASCTVPTVNVSVGDSFCATWIGVGGQFDETLIQAGPSRIH